MIKRQPETRKTHPNDPHHLPQNLRRHHRRRRPRRHGSCAGRCTHGRANAAAHPQHRNPRADVVQPLHRRHRQRASGARSRCARRRDGLGDRSIGHPVPPLKRQQRRGGTRHPSAGRPHSLQSRHPRNAGKPAEFGFVSTSCGRHHARRQPCIGRKNRDECRIQSARRGAHRRHIFGGQNPHRFGKLFWRPRRRPCRTVAFRLPERAAAAARPSENRHAAAHRRAHD